MSTRDLLNFIFLIIPLKHMHLKRTINSAFSEISSSFHTELAHTFVTMFFHPHDPNVDKNKSMIYHQCYNIDD